TALDVVRQLIYSMSRTEKRAEDAERTTLAGLTRLGIAKPDVARLEHLFGQSRSPTLGELSPEDELSLGRAALLSTFSRVGEKQKVLLLVDDAHLIDKTSHDLLVEVISRAGKVPLGLVAAARPVDSGGLWPRLKRM